MHWFRSNLRLGSRLALLALAVQMVLAFGHVHFYDLARASTTTAMATGSGASLLNGSPAGHHPGGSPDADCPICAAIQLVATSAPSVAPTLPLPPGFRSIRLQASAESAAASSPHALFQARAPPTA
jgi:hypothetical protein